MVEQELASIIQFLLDSTDNPSPFYWRVPENFVVPSAFFPEPEIVTGGETFLTYRMDYSWYIKFFHTTDEGAYNLGLKAITAVRGSRNLIPLLNEDHEETGELLRLNDPALRLIDTGVCQMTVTWTSRRPYDSTLIDKEKVQHFTVVRTAKGE